MEIINQDLVVLVINGAVMVQLISGKSNGSYRCQLWQLYSAAHNCKVTLPLVFCKDANVCVISQVIGINMEKRNNLSNK